MKKLNIAELKSIDFDKPSYALALNTDLVLIRPEGTDEVFVLYGRCQHRGALMSDARLKGDLIICCLHGSTYNYRTGTNIYYPGTDLKKFNSWVEQGFVCVDAEEIEAWEQNNPQRYNREAYQGLYADFKGTPEEPKVSAISNLAAHGLDKVGHHGSVAAMGVPREQLPSWDDIQLLTAQLHRPPLLDEEPVNTETVIGPKAKKPLKLDIPLFVSDMSFGALSLEAKTALSKGAELAGTGICSGEGGMLDEEQSANSRYFYELASARFGYSMEKIKRCQAFHFKCGQAAKTGTGGHLPGHKVTKKIAAVRGLAEGQAAISPARFPDWTEPSHFIDFAAKVRDATGGIPVGVKMSAQHIEKDIDAALEIGVDYIILDGRGGGTGAAPLLFRDNISVPTIPALARARRHLDLSQAKGVTLIITGGLRIPADFIKALALGADAIAVSNAAIQAIGCLGMRACHTNYCPVGIATQKPELRKRLPINEAAQRLNRFFGASVELMQVMARACGHSHLQQFKHSDLSTWEESMARLSGIAFSGAV